MSLLRTLLIILLVYYAVKFFVKLIGPYLIKKAVDTVQKKAQQQHGNSQETTVEEGKTIIDKKPTNIKNSNNDVGEYIDFEEID